MIHALVRVTPTAPPTGPERVRVQRAHARETLDLASARAGGPAGPWPQVEDGGRPLPHEGWHWSISHDAHHTAGALARRPVGIDTERVQERRLALAERVLNDAERALLTHHDPALAFTRAWCAKESVLKARGIGMAGLSRCRITSVEPGGLWLELDGATWWVQQALLGWEGSASDCPEHAECLIAVTAQGEDWVVDWGQSPIRAIEPSP